MLQNNQKTVFFYLAYDFFGAIWAPPSRPRKVNKGQQIGGMYGSMSKLDDKPLTKSLGPFFKKKWSETTRKLFFYATLCFSGPFGHPKSTQKGPQRSLSGWDA
jgi:hypothetical protein